MEAHSFLFKAGDIDINYRVQGSGRPVILLHGFGASCRTWGRLKAEFFHGFRLISIDLKGFGLSGKPRDQRYSARDQSDIVIKFIEKHDLRDVILVGHSFGGAVALLTCIRIQTSSEKSPPIAGMILIGAASFRQELPSFIRILQIPFLSHLLLALAPASFFTKIILAKAFYDKTRITREIVDIYAGPLKLPGSRHALIATAKKLVPGDMESITGSYSGIRMPVLLIWGEQDVIVPLEVGRRLESVLPGATLHIIRKCGHIPQEEYPEETSRLLLNFFNDID
jgi:pimeloyl-ACP methyl ester carboxylesterase